MFVPSKAGYARVALPDIASLQPRCIFSRLLVRQYLCVFFSFLFVDCREAVDVDLSAAYRASIFISLEGLDAESTSLTLRMRGRKLLLNRGLNPQPLHPKSKSLPAKLHHLPLFPLSLNLSAYVCLCMCVHFFVSTSLCLSPLSVFLSVSVSVCLSPPSLSLSYSSCSPHYLRQQMS